MKNLDEEFGNSNVGGVTRSRSSFIPECYATRGNLIEYHTQYVQSDTDGEFRYYLTDSGSGIVS